MTSIPILKFYLIGWHGNGALGDDLLEFTVKKIFEAAAYNLHIKINWVNTIDKADYIIIGGGTLLGFDSMGIVDIIRNTPKSYSIFGTGFRREKRDIGKKNRDNLTWLLNGADFVYVRGFSSQQFCVHAGFDNAKVISDPAIQFISEEPVLSEKFFKVGISLRYMNEKKESQYVDNQRIITIVQNILNLLNNLYPCHFFFFDLTENIYDSDLIAIHNLIELNPPSNPFEIIKISEGFHKIFSLISKMDYMVSQRLHPSIIAWSSGNPHVSIDYQNHKTEDFLSTLGHNEFLIRTDDYNINLYASKFERILKNRKIIKEHVISSIVYWRKRQLTAAMKILAQFI